MDFNKILKEQQDRLKEIQAEQSSFFRNIRQEQQRILSGQQDREDFLLAYNAFTHRPIFINPKQMKAHWHILGGTGKGKTKFLEHIAKSLIQQQEGICVIDPHGDLYDELVRFITRYRLEDKTILIDPNEDEWITGINYLERYTTDEKSIHDRVSLVLRAFMKVFGELDEGAKPRFERWGRDTLHVLTESGYTLFESRDFLGINNKVVRSNILSDVKDEFFLKEWHDFEQYQQREKLNLLESVYNRLNKFIGHERIRRIVGQAKSTVNFRQAMDEGKIVLINLAPRKFSQEIKKMLGVMMIDMIVEAAISRNNIPEEKRKPFYLMVDEFGEMVCDDFAYALDACRKFKVWLILAHQRLYQLEKDNPNVYDAVMNNTDIKISFGVSRQNAEIMAKEMFTGKIRGDKIKDEILQTKFRPVIHREIIESHSQVSSRSSGRGHSDASRSGQSSFKSQSLSPDSGLFFSDVLGISVGEGQSLDFVSADSEFESFTDTEGYSATEVPVTHYEEFKEITSRTFWSLDELTEKFISWIKNQDERHIQLQIGNRSPLASVTPWMEGTRVRETDVANSKQKILPTCTTPVIEVDRQIQTRQQLLLGKSKSVKLDLDQEDVEEAEFVEVAKQKPIEKPQEEARPPEPKTQPEKEDKLSEQDPWN